MCVRVEGWGWSIRPWGRDSRVGGLPILPAGVFASATFQSSPQPPSLTTLYPPSSQFPLIFCSRLSPFLCEFFSLSSSVIPHLTLVPSRSLSRARARARALLVTLSQSIQLDLPSHPPALHPRNAFQPPLTPPRPRPRCNLPLSPGPLPPSIPSAFP